MTDSIDHSKPVDALKRAWRGANRRWLVLAGGIVLLLLLIGLLQLRRAHLRHRLLATAPDAVTADAPLVRFAMAQAAPLYAKNCASCHGTDMRGNRAIGAPNLTDQVWLYGDGSVHQIERTLLYGIRSGLSKSHNVTDMPAFGSTGRMSAAEIRDTVQYVLQLSGQRYSAPAANDGKALYYGKAVCDDCHGYQGSGNADYGAPALNINVWNGGADEQSLYDAIYFGEHRIMPAWIGSLSLEQIRALAVYVYVVSHPHAAPVGSGY
jgi:cytochrome c oxidase cbb3-type subunit III